MPYIVKDKIKFLSEASKILSSSLDYNNTLSVVAGLVVDNIADFCIIDIWEGEELKRLTVRISDPKKRKLAEKFFNYLPDPTNKQAIYDAAYSGKPIVIKKVTDKWLQSVSKIQEERENVGVLGLKSFVFAPLKSRGKTIGVITIGSSKQAFSYSVADSLFIEELAGRAAMAVDNAKLFSETQDALKMRQNHFLMLQQIYKSALNFLAPQTLPETYRTAIEEAINLTQADYGVILLENGGILQKVHAIMPAALLGEGLGDEFIYKFFKKGITHVLSNHELENVYPTIVAEGISSLVVIPLVYNRKQIGVLTLLAKKNKHFNRERLEILRAFGGLVSLAIQKNKLYNEVTSSLETRDLFISMAGHELKTPTTTLLGYIQLMIKKYEKKEVPPKKWIVTLNAETLRLKNLINELLQIDHIKTGQFIYEWKNNSLKEIMKRVMLDAKINHPKHRIVYQDKLTVKNDVVVSDFDKLLQVIINLINNSVKFSPLKSTIKLVLTNDSDNFIISIIDQGKGIAAEDVDHIFEGFYKGHDHTREGMGLGLFLVENIIQRHGGSIEVKSKIGKGTTMNVILPFISPVSS